LYQTLGLPLPNKPTADKTPILIYGGSTATGTYGIQFAKLSGMTVIATASPKNHALLKDLGADHVVDYNSPTATDDIRSLTGGKLALAWDCHADKDSAAFCARAMGDGAGHYAALLFGVEDAVKAVNDKIKVETSLYYTIFGEPVWYGQKIEAKPADYEFGKMFWDLSKTLLDEGKVRPIKTSVNRGGSGLEGVIAGLEESRAGKVSAEKLVYTL
jgi:NADPH:quinone reductase-like Zn-dependent oxidoreductase